VDPTAGLDTVEERLNLLSLPGPEHRFLCRLASSLVTIPTAIPAHFLIGVRINTLLFDDGHIVIYLCRNLQRVFL
jgi:hypothetical protein